MLQRNYSLPSCTLLVEGISTGGDVLSIVTSFGCRFNHHPEPIVGGLELLKAMVSVIGAYAQSLASNNSMQSNNEQVQIAPEGKHFHVLSVMLNQSDANNPKQMQVKLNTIQLFDLMESLDRLCCDPTTLPEVNLTSQAAAQRTNSLLGNQVIPAIAGVFSVAIAASLLYLIPTPKPDPKPTLPQQTQPLPQPVPKVSPTVETSPSASPAPEGSVLPEPSLPPKDPATPEASPSPTN
ncbi:DUF4335 domain-containing protein [Pseudanabaena sp. FACHB-1277]|uniref:DUF4335 domain-containing protein n=1 Tax=Pseudanabaena cinerea FACHB-1277 TaxID=2949581 RepID=A0A926UVH7_9CYAN|nr:DUF4335 domain-containing protein [Pseudanabaena cinerea]MBD2152145.1 DUF4335 domain-containing protein [Pseudanabaena cinerea FACHB-1277]